LSTAIREISFLSEHGPHIFFSPHADDVVLSCGGTIHSLVSQGKPVEVIGVFAGIPETPRYSAYARHLHAKWHLPVNAIEERWREDSEAMRELGLTAFEHWDYVEAPYRSAVNGYPLYGANEELTGDVSTEDRKMIDEIAQRVRTHLEESPETAISYFPLSIGHHVDHQILFDVGLELRASGKEVRFYEDYPYAEAYEVNGQKEWQPKVVPIVVGPKSRASAIYVSQVRGLGGSPAALEKRLSSFGSSVGNGHPGERYWEIPIPAAKRLMGLEVRAGHPLVRKDPRIKFRDFGKFLKTFSWHDLNEVLPPGEGYCLDVGCGDGRHRNLIQTRGYKWLGLDQRRSESCVVLSNGNALPVAEQSVAAIVMWQVMEYVEQPEVLINEAARVLEQGGVFCGSVSFLEPVHGRTYFNLSPLILERLLRKNGFADVEIKAGLNGFILMLWTWLRRCGIPFADRLAVPTILVALAPLAMLIFLASWLRSLVGRGDGHTMRWLTQTAPLEFAGHVMFAARKKTQAAGPW
jgi:LmbE family N-acetylglucosaminyl deacetylase/SAM-dependent methyltransferase